MTKDLNDHSNITKLLQIQKKEYFTFNPAPGAVARFVLKGLPPNATCKEIADGLKSSGINVTHVYQIKKGRVDQETREKTLIPLAVWIITVEKAMENIANLNALTGLNHFRIRISDYRDSCSASDVRVMATRPTSVTCSNAALSALEITAHKSAPKAR